MFERLSRTLYLVVLCIGLAIVLAGSTILVLEAVSKHTGHTPTNIVEIENVQVDNDPVDAVYVNGGAWV